MVYLRQIVPPAGEDDTQGARRVCEEFFDLYQPALSNVEHYLEHILIETEAPFADAYRPWHKALQDLERGVYLLAKGIPLPDPDSFLDALHMFSFESAIRFLGDLCVSCRLPLPHDWARRFRQHIDTLLFSFSILARQQHLSMAR